MTAFGVSTSDPAVHEGDSNHECSEGMSRSLRNCALIVVAFLAVIPDVSRAQKVARSRLIIINMALGAGTAGISELGAGRSFWKGFAKGAVGGGVVFGGKCFVAQRSAATDWIGNGFVGVGSSMVANASSGRGIFRKLTIPIGPLLITRDNDNGHTSARVDLPDVVTATYFGLQSHNTWMPRQTFEHGSIFFEDFHGGVDFQAARVLLLRPHADKEAIAHELTHSAQASFVTIAWEDPLEGALLTGLPGGPWIHRHVELGVLSLVWAGLNSKLAVWDRPWEKEAHSFEIGC
jgi:hypothetical protein